VIWISIFVDLKAHGCRHHFKDQYIKVAIITLLEFFIILFSFILFMSPIAMSMCNCLIWADSLLVLQMTILCYRLIVITSFEVIKLLRISPSKHCSLNPAPTWLLKRTAVSITPPLCSMCSASLQSGSLPDTPKQAIVYPRLKNPTWHADDPCSFRPISNLGFISKLVERVVTYQFVLHSENTKLFPARQSAYRQFHST